MQDVQRWIASSTAGVLGVLDVCGGRQVGFAFLHLPTNQSVFQHMHELKSYLEGRPLFVSF